MFMSDAEKEQRISESKSKCICGECPSYTGTGETAAMFCGVGKSSVIADEKGCVCPDCPVQAEQAQRWTFYCTRGAAETQMHREKPEGVGVLADNTYKL